MRYCQPCPDQCSALHRAPLQRAPGQDRSAQSPPLHRAPLHGWLSQPAPAQLSPLQRAPFQIPPDHAVPVEAAADSGGAGLKAGDGCAAVSSSICPRVLHAGERCAKLPEKIAKMVSI